MTGIVPNEGIQIHSTRSRGRVNGFSPSQSAEVERVGAPALFSQPQITNHACQLHIMHTKKVVDPMANRLQCHETFRGLALTKQTDNRLLHKAAQTNPQFVAFTCIGRFQRAFIWLMVLFLGMATSVFAGGAPAGFSENYADVNGVRLHYFVGGKGSAVVLLHGYAETSHMWTPIMPKLATTHLVIVPDLRGAGDSSKPDSGYDKKTMAVDIHDLVASLGVKHATIVGHDIGLMVAYAYAAQFPQETDRLALMDAFLPGIGDWKNVWLMRDLWHFHFYGTTPLALVKGRERTYFEHFWNDFAADSNRSVPEADRRIYARSYARPGGMRAGFEYFKNFERDAREFAEMSATKLAMPVLVLTGEKASGSFLIEQAKLVATNVQGRVIAGSGHWLMEEAPQATIPALMEFIDGSSGN